MAEISTSLEFQSNNRIMQYNDDVFTEYKRKQWCPFIHHIKQLRKLSHKSLNCFTMFPVSRHLWRRV